MIGPSATLRPRYDEAARQVRLFQRPGIETRGRAAAKIKRETASALFLDNRR
jgi:hypothetical protein